MTQNNGLLRLSLFVFCLFFSQSLFAQSKQPIHVSYKYTLGDSDTKSDAKKIAFIEAKRLCLEKAGSYIESNTEVLDFRLSRDEIRTYTGGILKVEIISEEFKAIGENLTLFTEVKAEIDLKEVKESLKRVKEDKKFAEKVKEQEKQLQSLEDKIRKMQKQLLNDDFDKTSQIRQERKKVFTKIDELEQIKNTINNKSQEVTEKIEPGMSTEDVIKLVGQPRKKNACLSQSYYNYGKSWIFFESGIVRCIVPSHQFRGNCSSCR